MVALAITAGFTVVEFAGGVPSAHLVVEDRVLSECSELMRASEDMLRARFGISHTALQMECGSWDKDACVFSPAKGS